MLLGLGALVPTSCNSCRSWGWNNLSKTLRLTAVSWWICTPITQLPSDDQHLTKWLPLVGLYSGAPEIASVLLGKLFQPHTQGPPLPYESYESCVRVNDGIPLPTGHPLWPSQTSTFSVVEKYPSCGKIASVQRLVLWGIDPSDFVGGQVERIHMMPTLLPSPFHRRLFPLQFSRFPCSRQELERNWMPVFWSFHGSHYLARSCFWINRMV